MNEKSQLSKEESELWNALSGIQKFSIGFMLCQVDKYKTIEDLLTDMSYEIIYSIMELIDGYKDEKVKYELVNVKSNNVINSNVDLHNYCEEFLKCTNI